MTPEQELARMEQDRDLTKAQLDHANDELARVRSAWQVQTADWSDQRRDLRAQLQAAQEERDALWPDTVADLRAVIADQEAEIERLTEDVTYQAARANRNDRERAAALAEIERLRGALEVIAGQRDPYIETEHGDELVAYALAAVTSEGTQDD